MNDQELNEAIAARPAEKVTKESIEARIANVEYMVLPNMMVTLCNIVLVNGFSVRGESACVYPENFDAKIGRELAYRDAFGKLWKFEGYLLAERRFRAAA